MDFNVIYNGQYSSRDVLISFSSAYGVFYLVSILPLLVVYELQMEQNLSQI